MKTRSNFRFINEHYKPLKSRKKSKEFFIKHKTESAEKRAF